MYILSVNIWFQKLMKQFFFGIDQVVYGAISSIYDLLISIARTSIFTQADIIEMGEKVYKLLAVFMIFKVTFSLITYVVNPDDFSDKNKGVSKLSMNIVISLGLLILNPYIFNAAYKLQNIILEDNSLAMLIFENSSDSEGGESNNKADFLNTAGDDMAFITMSAFFSPNTSIDEFQNCITLKEGNTFNKACSGLYGRDKDYAIIESSDEVETSKTMAQLTRDEKNDFSLKSLQNYVVGVENRNFGLMFRQDLAVATVKTKADDTMFVMDYKFIFSTVIGVVIVLLLITFCMDVALRSIKLGFLQLIAPIPILSYVDPKSGKDGMFKKWYQLCFKTYLSLFIRLLALYFAVYIISKVADMQLVDIIDGSQQTHAFIYIFVIIGALMFAKQLPKILEGLGIKLDGDGKFFLNPFKKFEESTMGGKNITGMARGAMVGTAGTLSGAGIGRGISGAWRGMTSGKGWKETGKAEAEMNRKMRQAKLDGSSFGGRLGARFASTTGFRSASENIAREKNRLETKNKENDNKIKSIEDKIAPTKTKIAEQKKFSDAVKSMEDRAKSEIEAGNSWVGQEYFARKKNASFMSDNIGKKVTREITQRDEDYAVYSAAKSQKDMETASKRIKTAEEKMKSAQTEEARIEAEQEMKSAQQDYDKAQNQYEQESSLAYEIHEKLINGDTTEEIVVTADDAARAESMVSSWVGDEGMKKYMTDATNGTIDDATFRNARANAEQAGKTIGVELSTDGGKIHSQYGASKGATGDLQRAIYDDERQIEEIKLEKAKLGDQMRDIELRERKIKADESAIK